MADRLSPSRKSSLKKLVGKFIDSKIAGVLANTPPFSFILRRMTQYLLKERLNNKVITSPERTRNIGLEAALDGIVQDVVDVFGYVGAMVAAYDKIDDALPVKAFYVDEHLATKKDIKKFEKTVSEFTSEPISISDQKIARVYVHKQEHQKNLGVKAFHKGEAETSVHLFDLFTPIIPDSSKPVIEGIQQELHIKEVITVPFFLDVTVDGELQKEFVGNLFVAKRDIITDHDKLVLTTLGQYVASLIQSENRRQLVEIIDNLVLDIQKNLASEDQVLHRIVQGIVEDLGYFGAMVAPYEKEENVLPIKAFDFDKNNGYLTVEKIKELEKQVSQITTEPVSLTDPQLARVYLDDQKYRDNLSIIAAKSGKPEKRKDLYDLFIPFAPLSSKSMIEEVQKKIGVHRVIAVPFFLESWGGEKELLGNLFALSRSYEITDWEIDVLQAFGQQAAAGLQNVRLHQKTEELLNTTRDLLQEKEGLLQETQELYRKSEDRRKAAEIFGKMAFTATATLHAFRNDLGAIRMGFQMLSDILQRRMDRLANRLESLKEPFSKESTLNEPVNINTSLQYAFMKVKEVFGNQYRFENPDDTSEMPAGEQLEKISKILVKMDLQDNLPAINTVPEMLSEAFKVLIKNAVEAISEKESDNRLLLIRSEFLEEKQIIVTIQDNGRGIKPEYLEKVFELGTTTKDSGLGFGLFWTKDYIEGLSGDIDMSSVWGEGTTVKIYLPTTINSLPSNQETTN